MPSLLYVRFEFDITGLELYRMSSISKRGGGGAQRSRYDRVFLYFVLNLIYSLLSPFYLEDMLSDIRDDKEVGIKLRRGL